jgi:hypothetical protein
VWMSLGNVGLSERGREVMLRFGEVRSRLG